ncbi:MAG: alkaline phosphatase family protein [Halorhodospira sp.]
MDRPSYEGDGLVNLMARLGSALGAPAGPYPPLDTGASLGLEEARTVILWLIDGLGDHYLARHPDSALARDRARGMTSVFPPTTSAALTSVATGLPPRAHGVTGWFMYVHELGAVTAWLPFGPRVGRGQWVDLEPESARLLEREPLWGRFEAEPHVVQPAWLVDTPYSRATTGESARRHGYQGLAGLIETLSGIARAPGGQRRFVYAYWPELDALCHQHGVGSTAAQEHFRAIDDAWQRLLTEVAGTGTVVLGIADHGLIDTAPERTLYLADHPELAATLALPLCGEPRAAYCYLRNGAEADFQAYVRERLGHVCQAVPSEELLAAGWFGPAPEHPQLRRRIGDWVLLPADGWVIKDRLVGEGAFGQVGVHGGVSAAEQRVPLIAARP